MGTLLGAGPPGAAGQDGLLRGLFLGQAWAEGKGELATCCLAQTVNRRPG